MKIIIGGEVNLVDRCTWMHEITANSANVYCVVSMHALEIGPPELNVIRQSCEKSANPPNNYNSRQYFSHD